MNRFTKHGRRGEIRRAGSRGFASGMLTVVLLFLIALAGFVWVGLGIVANDRWPIRWLEINGSFQRVDAERLRSTLQPLIDESFFTIDLQEMRDAARRISWVSGVTIQKAWPDTVTVTIEEYVPLAHWNRGHLISSRGDAFAVPEADAIQGLPWLQGPDARRVDVLRAWSDYSELLVPLGLEIRSLSLDQRGAWSLMLSNGTHVRLGRDHADERFARLLASWEPLTRQHEAWPQDIDMRYTNGFAVLWPQHLEPVKGSDS